MRMRGFCPDVTYQGLGAVAVDDTAERIKYWQAKEREYNEQRNNAARMGNQAEAKQLQEKAANARAEIRRLQDKLKPPPAPAAMNDPNADLKAIAKRFYPDASSAMLDKIASAAKNFPAVPPDEAAAAIAKSTVAYIRAGGETNRPIVNISYEKDKDGRSIAVPYETTYSYDAYWQACPGMPKGQPMSDQTYDRLYRNTGKKYDPTAGCQKPKMSSREAFVLGAGIIVSGGLALNAIAAAGATAGAAGGAAGTAAGGVGAGTAGTAAAGTAGTAAGTASTAGTLTAATTGGITEIVVTGAAPALLTPTVAGSIGAGLATGAVALTAAPPAVTEAAPIEEIVVEESRIVEQPVSLEEAAATGLTTVGISIPEISVPEPSLPEIDIADESLLTDVKNGLVDAVEQYGTEYVGSQLEQFLTDQMGRPPTQTEVTEWGDWIDTGADPNNAPDRKPPFGLWLLGGVLVFAAVELARKGGKKRKRE